MTSRPPWEDYGDFADVQSGGTSSTTPSRPPWEDFQAEPAELTPQEDAMQQRRADMFPSPMESAASVVGSGLRSIPGMVVGAGQQAITAGRLASGGAPAMEVVGDQASESWQHLKNAASYDARDPRGLGEVVSAIPVVGPAAVGAVQAAGRILTPVAKTATQGPGSVTPQEMRTASETAGPAIVALAAPKVTAAMTPARIISTLKLVPKVIGIKSGATATAAAGRFLVNRFVVGPAMEAVGTMVQDRILEAVRAGDVAKAAEVIAKAAEKNPEVAAIHAESVAAVPAASVAAPTVERAAMTAAERHAQNLAASQAPMAPPEPLAAPVAAPGPVQAIPAPAEAAPPVAAPRTPAQNLAGLPAKGESRIPTIFTNPAKTPKGTPLTPKQRALQIRQLQAASEAGEDIFKAFGIEPQTSATKLKAAAVSEGPAGTSLFQFVGPKGDRIVIAAKKGAKGASEFNPAGAVEQAGKHELQADKISRRLGTDEWQQALEDAGLDPDEALGFAHFGPGGTKKLSPGMVYVSPEFQRNGIATAMYDAAKAHSGLEIGKGVQRPQGAAFRRAYDAKMVDKQPPRQHTANMKNSSAAAGSLKDRIRAAYLKSTADGRFNQRARIADVHKLLPDVDPGIINETLLEMQNKDHSLSLMQLDNHREITAADRLAKIQVGDEPRHILWIER